MMLLIVVFRIWDTRKLQNLAVSTLSIGPPTPPPSSPARSNSSNADDYFVPIHLENIDFNVVQNFTTSVKGRGSMLADWPHKKSVSSAYWDPRGRNVVSTCYDDALRSE